MLALNRTHGSRRGFTLLEMSVVIAIIALVAAGSLVSLTAYVQTSQYNATVSEIATIEQALQQFSAANSRLPCPSSLTVLPSDTHGYYGTESANPGTCIGGTPAANFSANFVTEGGIPTRALRLPDSYMYDAWGNRLRYAVYAPATASGTVPAPVLNGAIFITIYDSTGAVRTSRAVYAIVSHGANGHGAYTSNGVAINAGSTNTNEQINCHCTSTGASGGYPYSPTGVSPTITTPTYVQMLPYVATSNLANAFDDIVTYKEGWQLAAANSPLLTTSQITSPISQALYPTAGIYFSDRNNQRIRLVNMATGIITTIAGNGTASYGGDGGQATNAELQYPNGIAMDSYGDLYIADGGNNRIRKVAATGIITTVAGNGTGSYGGDNGQATAAEINGPYGIALDSSGNIYIADTSNNRIREVMASSGVITTVAGNGTGAYGGDNGQATAAEINGPYGVAVDSSGNIYIGDTSNQRVRKVTASSGIISTYAGNGTNSYGGDAGQATAAELSQPNLLALDNSGNLYISDFNNVRVRMVTSTGLITTVVGDGTPGTGGNGGQATSATINGPTGIAVDSAGNIYVGQWWSTSYVRKVTASTGIISAYVGGGTQGYAGDGGQASAAEVNTVDGIAIGR